MITNSALNDLLNAYFRNGSVPAALYLGLVAFDNFTGFAAGDSMSSHAGWQELTTYSESTRQLWTPSAASGLAIVNPSLVQFTMASPSSVYGVFLCTNATKGGTSGILIGPVALDQVQILPTGEKFKVQATLSAVSG